MIRAWYELRILVRLNIITNEKGRIEKNKGPNLDELNHISSNFSSAPQWPPIPRPLMNVVPPLRTSAAATSLSQLVLRRCRYRLPDLVSSFRHFKLRQGVKWTIKTDDPFFGSCDIHLAAIATAPGQVYKTHAEANQLTYPPPGRYRRPALVPPVPGLALVSAAI